MNKLQRIKAAQLAQAGKNGINPYDTEAITTAPIATKQPDSLAHYQAALTVDRARLSALATLEDKARAKSEMITHYWPFIEQYQNQGHAYPNEVAVWMMVWLFDIGDIERGVKLALHLAKQNLHIMPAKFDRDLRTFICDAVYDWANVTLKADQSASPYLDQLAHAIEQELWVLSPPVKSKIFALLAKHKVRVGDYQTAMVYCDKAEQVNPDGAGVKKLKQTAQAQLNKQDKSS